MLKRIALRNIARHKVKTILSSLAIMVSVAVFIFINSWLGGMSIESRRNIVNFEMGAAKLQTKLYFERREEMPSYENFTGWEVFRNALDSEGYNSAPRFVFKGTLFSHSGSAPILFHGVDPAAEAQTLRYVPYVDFGRYVQDGNFEIALGTFAAERLHVGIPMRPLRLDLEELIAEVAGTSAGEADFIRSLYDLAPLSRDILSPVEITNTGNERMILRKNVPQADLDRYWDMIAASGRNDVRVNAVIDIRAVPETISPQRWEGELMPALRAGDISLVSSAYEYMDFMEAYLLVEEDERQQALVLDAMIRAGFSGAVRHVNQLMDLVVVGVINSPAPLPNSYTAYIPLDILQDETGMMLQGAVTELVIRSRNTPDHQLPGAGESGVAITAALKRSLEAQGLSLPENLAVRGWVEYMSEYLNYEALEVGMAQIIALLLFLLSFLGISNTILMAILERTRETGMMRAMGMNESQIVKVYMLESAYLGLIGSVLGIILGCIMNYPMVKHGVDISGMADIMGGAVGFRMSSVFRSVWNLPLIIGTGIGATVIASLMAFFPANRAAKMPITDSLRFE